MPATQSLTVPVRERPACDVPPNQNGSVSPNQTGREVNFSDALEKILLEMKLPRGKRADAAPSLPAQQKLSDGRIPECELSPEAVRQIAEALHCRPPEPPPSIFAMLKTAIKGVRRRMSSSPHTPGEKDYNEPATKRP
ncbi:MAG: hypothetical protein EBZ48_11895, partial [Proteobacteria bacterium]|nr:hypothetical protein [Pseudomonadota bacterium]